MKNKKPTKKTSSYSYSRSPRGDSAAPTDSSGHIPVMMAEVISALDPKPGEFMIDGTFGLGGHSKELFARILPGGKLLAVDRDPKAISAGKEIFSEYGDSVSSVNANFSELPEIINDSGFSKADGLLLDLGFSSVQLGEGRGFSFLSDEPLLMTYSDVDEPLISVLPRLSKNEIKDIIALTGERYAARLADAIRNASRKHRIQTTGELVKIIVSALPKGYEHGRIHPATRTFLAFRMFVNHELEDIRAVISKISDILKPGGRAAIITFQSLEDRTVKEEIKKLLKEKKIMVINKKPLPVSTEEARANPRARSAKLRSFSLI